MSKAEPAFSPEWLLSRRAVALLADCSFDPYKWEIEIRNGLVLLFARYPDADIYTGRTEQQTTRKWVLSEHMTDSEIVSTAFKCVMTSMEHRTRERFKYRGARIFGPHFDVTDLVRLCRDGREAAGGRDAQGQDAYRRQA